MTAVGQYGQYPSIAAIQKQRLLLVPSPLEDHLLDALDGDAVVFRECEQRSDHADRFDEPEGYGVGTGARKEQQQKSAAAPDPRNRRPAMSEFIRHAGNVHAAIVECVSERFARLLVAEMRREDRYRQDERIKQQANRQQDRGFPVERRDLAQREAETGQGQQRKERRGGDAVFALRDQHEGGAEAIP